MYHEGTDRLQLITTFFKNETKRNDHGAKKNKMSYRVTVETDPLSGTVQAVYLQIREGKASEVVEFGNGDAFANYNRAGELIGIEILAPCNIQVFERIIKTEKPEQRKNTRKFVRGAVPQQMVVAA